MMCQSCDTPQGTVIRARCNHGVCAKHRLCRLCYPIRRVDEEKDPSGAKRFFARGGLEGLQKGVRFRFRLKPAAVFQIDHVYCVGRGTAKRRPMIRFRLVSEGISDRRMSAHKFRQFLRRRVIEQVNVHGTDRERA
jgi:hypothetical protein